MTVVDSSAIIAILRDEPDADRFIAALDAASEPRISAASYLEAAVVVDSARDPVASRRFDDLVAEAALTIEPFTQAQARIARDAYRDFGKGSGHKAGLNFGDCFTYALAKATGEPLLFKGNDFSHTDITPVLGTGGS
jgi:ribonuclease VapC